MEYSSPLKAVVWTPNWNRWYMWSAITFNSSINKHFPHFAPSFFQLSGATHNYLCDGYMHLQIIQILHNLTNICSRKTFSSACKYFRVETSSIKSKVDKMWVKSKAARQHAVERQVEVCILWIMMMIRNTSQRECAELWSYEYYF